MSRAPQTLLFLCLFIGSVIHASDERGISYCRDNPKSPYVCEQCVGMLHEESPECTCDGWLTKDSPNPACPYHYNKYLTWLDKSSASELPDITPIPEDTYISPLAKQLAPSSQRKEEEEEIYVGKRSAGEPIYVKSRPKQPLSSSAPSRPKAPITPPEADLITTSDQQLSSSSGRSTFMKKLRGVKKEKAGKKAAKKATSAPASKKASPSSSEDKTPEKKKVQFTE